MLNRLRGRLSRSSSRPGAGRKNTSAEPHAEPENLPEATSVEDIDRRAEGWYDTDTGELYPGFGAGPGDTVLDIGCGEVPFSQFLAASGARIVLADIDAPGVAVAERRTREAGARDVTALATDCDPIPLPDRSATRIICHEVLEHVKDPKAFLAEMARVGSPGALYLISVPHGISETLQQDFAAPQYFEPPNHIRTFGDGELDDHVRSAGLEILSSESLGFYYTMWWLFFWVSAQPQLGPPFTPLLQSWTKTWRLALETRQGLELKAQLDARLPKSQVILARLPS